MTSSGPIHHSRFPAQQGQAALLAVTTASSLAHFTQAALEKLCGPGAAQGKGSDAPGPRGKRGTGRSHFALKHSACVHCMHLLVPPPA